MEEIWDILDEEGNITGKTMKKGEREQRKISLEHPQGSGAASAAFRSRVFSATPRPPVLASQSMPRRGWALRKLHVTLPA